MKWTYSNNCMFEMIASINISFDQTIKVATQLGLSDFVDFSKLSQDNHYVKYVLDLIIWENDNYGKMIINDSRYSRLLTYFIQRFYYLQAVMNATQKTDEFVKEFLIQHDKVHVLSFLRKFEVEDNHKFFFR